MLSPLFFPFFVFNVAATTEIYTLSLHDALPILVSLWSAHNGDPALAAWMIIYAVLTDRIDGLVARALKARSEEHTSELQSQSNLVCRLLLEKKKRQPKNLEAPTPEGWVRERAGT